MATRFEMDMDGSMVPANNGEWIAFEEYKNLRDAVLGLIDALGIPEKNCTCHKSPPCGDCVEYSEVREALEKLDPLMAPQDAAQTEGEVRK